MKEKTGTAVLSIKYKTFIPCTPVYVQYNTSTVFGIFLVLGVCGICESESHGVSSLFFFLISVKGADLTRVRPLIASRGCTVHEWEY